MVAIARCNPGFRGLSESRQKLIRLMQHTHFGRIEQLVVRAGQPVLDPLPRVIQTVKIGGRNQPRPQVEAHEFALKQEWIEFFEHLDALGNGTALIIEVAHGLPLFFEVEQLVCL